jgi:hypothetical protein
MRPVLASATATESLPLVKHLPLLGLSDLAPGALERGGHELVSRPHSVGELSTWRAEEVEQRVASSPVVVDSSREWLRGQEGPFDGRTHVLRILDLPPKRVRSRLPGPAGTNLRATSRSNAHRLP